MERIEWRTNGRIRRLTGLASQEVSGEQSHSSVQRSDKIKLHGKLRQVDDTDVPSDFFKKKKKKFWKTLLTSEDISISSCVLLNKG